MKSNRDVASEPSTTAISYYGEPTDKIMITGAGAQQIFESMPVRIEERKEALSTRVVWVKEKVLNKGSFGCAHEITTSIKVDDTWMKKQGSRYICLSPYNP